MVIFSDGFETNNFNAWTGTTTTAGETATVEALNVHHGSFNANFTTDGSATGEQALAYKTLVAATTLYARAYFKILTALPANGKYYSILTLAVGGNYLVRVEINNTAGVYTWGIRYHVGATHTLATYTPPSAIALNTWYCVEIKSVEDAVVGEARLYIGGTEVITKTDLDTSAHGAMTRHDVGEYYSLGQTAHSIIVDCDVVDSSYIGPEVSGVVLRRNLVGVGLQAKIYDLEKFKPKMPTWNPLPLSSIF